jgi:hypothetical protein
MTVMAAARKRKNSTMARRVSGAEQVAEPVHPRVGAFDDPAFADLDR